MSAFLVTDTPAVVEPNHRVVLWLGQNHGPIPGKVVLHAPTPDDFLNAVIEHVQPGLVEDFDCALVGDPEKTKALVDILLDQYRYASRQAHFDLNTLRWTYKICALQTMQKIYNLPGQIRTAKQLADFHRDEACLIIGAGPSLDIAGINPEKILTIATSRTALLCFRHGWCPDYIVHIDPDPFDNLCEQLIRHPLAQKARWLTAMQVHQKFTRLPGPTFWFGSRLNPASLWFSKETRGQPEIPLITSGGSVSCCAFTLAEFMGCSPICLIGQDLSYHGTTKYYSDTSATDRFSSVSLAEPDRLDLPAIGGGTVQTTMDYMSYADWFLRNAKHTRKKLINCTTRGVHLPGFEHTSIDSVYRRYGRRRKKKPDPPALVFNRPRIVPALEKARDICRKIDRKIGAGLYAEALERLMELGNLEADGFFLTGCTQYEAKILSYYTHRSPDHPQMKRCIEMLAKATSDACAMLEDALNGEVRVPALTEKEVAHRMKELHEINTLTLDAGILAR